MARIKTREIEVSDAGDVLVTLAPNENFVWIDVDRKLSIRIKKVGLGAYAIDAFRSGSECDDPSLKVEVRP